MRGRFAKAPYHPSFTVGGGGGAPRGIIFKIEHRGTFEVIYDTALGHKLGTGWEIRMEKT
jgi:hypothetical protein